MARGGGGGQPPQQHPAQPSGHRAPFGGRPHFAPKHRGAQRLQRLAREGALAVERLVQRHAEGELVGGRGRELARELLGRHVRGGAHHRARLGEGLVEVRHAHRGDGADRLVAPSTAGEAEVGHPYPTVAAEEHVVGLEIAVDQVGGVGRREAAPGLREDLEHLGDGPGLRPQPLAQGLAFDVLHRDEDRALELPHVVHGDHVGVSDAGDGLRLADQAGSPLAHLGGQEHLDRDAAIELGVVGARHPGRATARCRSRRRPPSRSGPCPTPDPPPRPPAGSPGTGPCT